MSKARRIAKPPILMMREGRVLVPFGRIDVEAIELIKPGRAVRVEARVVRSAPQNRLYWAVLKGVVEATGRWATVEQAHMAIKLHLGFWSEFSMVDGQVGVVAESTAFDAMDDVRFSAYLEDALNLIVTEIVPGADPADLIAVGKGFLHPSEIQGATWPRPS